MHRSTRVQACGRGSEIAVLDTIHGAGIIAEKMMKMGLEAVALDVYHQTPDLEGYDTIVSPVHLSPDNPALARARRERKRILTHHQATGELLREELAQIEVFEVTGTHSKTTTAILLSMMLSRRGPVLSHTTRGLELWRDGRSSTIEMGLSITPGNVIRAAKEAEALDAKSLICEISLGGTGLADFGIITSLKGDYRIAGGSRWASTAKLQMLSLAKRGAKILANSDARISCDRSFGKGASVRALGHRLLFSDEELTVQMDPELDLPGYETALAASAAAADSAGLDRGEIALALDGFDGLSGRMKIQRSRERTLFDCSNSGLKAADVARALDRSAGPGLVAVIGEDAKTVCEGMNIPALSALLRERRSEIDVLILVGERLMPLAGELGAASASDLQQGLAMADACGARRLLSCVKCFR